MSEKPGRIDGHLPGERDQPKYVRGKGEHRVAQCHYRRVDISLLAPRLAWRDSSQHRKDRFVFWLQCDARRPLLPPRAPKQGPTRIVENVDAEEVPGELRITRRLGQIVNQRRELPLHGAQVPRAAQFPAEGCLPHLARGVAMALKLL